MENRTVDPPSHLQADTRQWFRSVVGDYVLEDHHVRLLVACCEAWDRAETARRKVKREGMFYTDRFGQPKPHPGVDVERKARDQFRLLLRELGLDVAPPNENRAPGPATNANLRLHG